MKAKSLLYSSGIWDSNLTSVTFILKPSVMTIDFVIVATYHFYSEDVFFFKRRPQRGSGRGEEVNLETYSTVQPKPFVSALIADRLLSKYNDCHV